MNLVADSLDLTGTINTFEVTRGLIAAIGIIYTLKVLLKCYLDLFALRLRGINHLREYSAITSLLLYSGILSVHFMLFTLAVYLMTIPSTNAPSISYYISTGLYVLSSLMLTSIAIIIDIRRGKIIEMIAEFEEKNING